MSDEPGEDRTSGERSSDDRWGRDRSEGERDDVDGQGRDVDSAVADGEDGAWGEHADGEADQDADDEEYEPSLAGVFGAKPEDAPPRPEIVPESPDLENALFVLLGVLFGLFVIYRAVVVFTA